MKLLCLLLLVLPSTSTLKILLLPADHKGHVNFFKVAGLELQKRGHEVVLLAHHRNKHLLEDNSVPYILNEGNAVNPFDDYNNVKAGFFNSGLQQLFSVMKIASGIVTETLASCYQVIQNEEIMKTLEEQEFDIALIDGLDAARCFYIIPYKLEIPYISLLIRSDPWGVGIPAMPSVEGFFGVFVMSKSSGYIKIFQNLGLYMIFYMLSPPPPNNNNQIKELAPEKPETTYQELFRNSGVFLLNNDNFCMDYPKLEAPHYRFIGGMAANPARPVPEEFNQFIRNADHGLIVVSFGSLVKQAPEEMMTKMMAAFRKIRQLVVMRYDGKLDNVPDNVMLAKWLPQNDLLGHPKTRLFIAHGGVNGQMEALYHGVPMIVMPFAADQMYSATRAEEKQFGKYINPMDFTTEELTAAISQVLDNPIYAKNIQKCSQITKSFPDAHEQIHFWVEHIMKFGGDHLKPISLDMPLYRMFMLDVLFILLVIDVIFCYVIYKCCQCTYRRCRSQKGASRKSKKE